MFGNSRNKSTLSKSKTQYSPFDYPANAYPLEQNIKNHECDGIVYKIIKEDKKYPPFPDPYQVSPSRKAQNLFLKQQLRHQESRSEMRTMTTASSLK